MDESFSRYDITMAPEFSIMRKVEKIEYKEILTPKYSKVVSAAGDLTFEAIAAEQENVSDEAYARRHEKSAAMERRRYLEFFKVSKEPNGSQHKSGSHHRKTDGKMPNTIRLNTTGYQDQGVAEFAPRWFPMSKSQLVDGLEKNWNTYV